MNKKIYLFFCLMLFNVHSEGLFAAAATSKQKAEKLFSLINKQRNEFEAALKEINRDDEEAFKIFFNKMKREGTIMPGAKKSCFASLWTSWGLNSYDAFEGYYLNLVDLSDPAVASVASTSTAPPPLPPRPELPPRPAASSPKGAPAPHVSPDSSASAASSARTPADNQAWYIAHLERGFMLLAERKDMGAWTEENDIATPNDLIREMNKIGEKWFGKASAPGAGKGPERSTSPRTKGFERTVNSLKSFLSGGGKASTPTPEPLVTSEPAAEPASDPKGKAEDKTVALTEFTTIDDVFEIDTDAFDTFLGHNE